LPGDQIGQDSLEKILPVSEYNALHEKRSILLSTLPKKRIFRPSPERASDDPPTSQPAETSIADREESSQTVATATRESPVATPLGDSCASPRRTSVDMKSEKNDSRRSPEAGSPSPPPPRRATTSGENFEPRAAVNKAEAARVDERRVAPIIIRGSKITTADRDAGSCGGIGSCGSLGSGIHVEKIEVIRLPAKFNGKATASTTVADDASSKDSAEEPRPKPLSLKKSKSKSVDCSVETQSGGHKKKQQQQRKSELFVFR
jgi:hypothetical protein